MVARGGVGDPFLVRRIDTWFREGRKLPDPEISQQISWCRELSEAVVEEKGEAAGVRKLRSIAPKFIAGCDGCKEYRRALSAEPTTKEELFRMLDELEDRIGSETPRARTGKIEKDSARWEDRRPGS